MLIAPDNYRALLDGIIHRARSINGSVMATADVASGVVRELVNDPTVILAEVWAVDPRGNRLTLATQAIRENKAHLLPNDRLDVLDGQKSLTGLALRSRRVSTFFNLLESNSGLPQFQDQALRKSLNLRQMYSVPIVNTSNPYQTLCVLNVFFDDNTSEAQQRKLQTKLETLAKALSPAIEANLRERCYRASTLLGIELATCQELKKDSPISLGEACGTLARCCLAAVNATTCSVYLYDKTLDQLTHRVTEGATKWEADPIPQKVLTVFNDNRELFEPRTRIIIDNHDAPTDTDDCIMVPIQDLLGRCQGVIRCLNRSNWCGSNVGFCYDDIAVLDSLTTAFMQPLESLLESEKRQLGLQKLCHEMHVPVATFCLMLRKLKRECLENNYRFSHPHFVEGEIFTDLMKRLLLELDLARYGPSEVPLRPKDVNVIQSVIRPAIRFAESFLGKRDMRSHQISYSGFKRFPELTIDAALICQVVFNLLDNASKHFRGNPADFKCKVSGVITDTHYEIVVSDNGPGIEKGLLRKEKVTGMLSGRIEPEFVERVFHYGVQGEGRKRTVDGEGLGMWVSRAIAKRHGGDLIVGVPTGHWSTSFVLRLPLTVSSYYGSTTNRR